MNAKPPATVGLQEKNLLEGDEEGRQ